MTDDPARWLRRGTLSAIIVLGWVFIAWQNKFHVTAPVAFVCLGFLAIVMTIFNLWRTGAAAVSPDLGNNEAWARPLGARGELEKEKRTLLKAIKEAEFDQQMGKLSKADADTMIQTYRARAIAVIKELERFEDVSHPVDPSGRILDKKDTVRDQIAREVKARLELSSANKKAKKKAETVADKAAAKAEKAAAKAEKADKPAKVETTDDKVETADAKVETAADKVEAATDAVETADKVATPVEVGGAEPKSDSTEATS